MTRHDSRRAAAQRSEGDETLKGPKAVVVTEPVSVGSTGRPWRLPFTGTLQRSNPERGEGPISITVPLEPFVVRQTCEFLRANAPDLYKQLWRLMRDEYPVSKEWPDTRRLARDVVRPDQTATLIFEDATETRAARRRESPDPIPSPFPIPRIDEDHWAYRRHLNPGNYTTTRSGDPKKLAQWEAKHDTETILHYIERYRELASEIKGKTLWKATHEPGFRDPYITCIELCLELRIPSHFLALVHYGIGLQLMHETSLPWERKFWRSETHEALHNTLKDSFRTIARMYREDFGDAIRSR